MNGELYLAWLHARLDQARALPPDTLLLIIVMALLLLANSVVAAMNSGRRARTLEEANAALAAEVGTSRRALDAERKWRMVAEKLVAEANRPPKVTEPTPPEEPEALPEADIPGLIQPAVAEIAPPAAKPTSALAPLPPRELHELLERENRDPIQPAAPVTLTRQDIEAELASRSPCAPAEDAAAAPAAPPAAAVRKAKPAKKMSARRAAKVADLINRTILE